MLIDNSVSKLRFVELRMRNVLLKWCYTSYLTNLKRRIYLLQRSLFDTSFLWRSKASNWRKKTFSLSFKELTYQRTPSGGNQFDASKLLSSWNGLNESENIRLRLRWDDNTEWFQKGQRLNNIQTRGAHTIPFSFPCFF